VSPHEIRTRWWLEVLEANRMIDAFEDAETKKR
jgi:hypothetical protein